MATKGLYESYLLLIIILTQSESTCGGSYCGNYCVRDCHVLDVCVLDDATAPTIAIDSTGAPAGDNTICRCRLTHNLGTNTTFYISAYTNNQHGLEMEINNFIFENTTMNKEMILQSGSYVTFSQLGEDILFSRLCLMISTGANGPNISINCYTSDSVTTTKRIQSPPTSTERPSTDSINQTTTHVSTDKPDNITAIIAGCAGGGALIIIIIVSVAVCIFCGRKNKNETEDRQEDNTSAFDESDYYMKTNACYVSADSVSPLSTYDTVPKDTIRTGYKEEEKSTEYSTVDKTKKARGGNTTVAESDYNHLNDFNQRMATGNLYNTFSADTLYNTSKQAGKGKDLAMSEYDTVNKVYK